MIKYINEGIPHHYMLDSESSGRRWGCMVLIFTSTQIP